MTPGAVDAWSHFGTARPKGEQLLTRLARPEITDRLFAAVDAGGERHLLVRLMEADTGLTEGGSKGLGVSTRELTMAGGEPSRFIDLRCLDPAGFAVLDLIATEIGQGLAQGTLEPARCVSIVLAKWKRFWGQPGQIVLGREEQIGLFAELWFLATWLLPLAGARAASWWKGPLRSHHDFAWPGVGVEVKATTAGAGLSHRVNGVSQLLSPEGGRLFFFSMRLREEPGATNALPVLVAKCTDQLSNSPGDLAAFEAVLAEARYSSHHEGEYSQLRLRVMSEALYAVENDFPRLTLTTFGGSLPDGVEQVEYSIDLGGFSHLVIADRPGLPNLLSDLRIEV